MSPISKHAPILVAVFFLFAYLLPLGARELVIPDETRYAEIPREMIATGDWISPKLNGLRYFEKPVMGYWIHAVSLLAFGENNFAVRFPSVAAVALSALLLYARVRRTQQGAADTVETPSCAHLTVLVFLSNILVFGIGNMAVLDSLFSAFVTASLLAFFSACEARRSSMAETVRLVLAGVACGLGLLTKGFLAFVIPVVTIFAFLLWERRFKDLLRMGWIPVVVACLVVLPWGLAIYFREPDFWRFFFWNEHIRRFAADNAQHKESFWFFFWATPIVFIPWSFLGPAALSGLKDRLSERNPVGRLLRFSLCWLVLTFLVFSLSRGKLITYVLPCFAPLSILVAFGLEVLVRKPSRIRWMQGGIVANTLLFGLMSVAAVVVQWVGIDGQAIFRETWKGWLLVLGCLSVVGGLVAAYRSGSVLSKVFWVGVSPLVLFWAVHYTVPDRIVETQSPGPFLSGIRYDPSRDAIILCDEESTAAVCWYFKRRDIYVVELGGEQDYGLHYPDAAGRLIPAQEVAAFIRQHPGKTLFIAQTKHVREWRSLLPEPTEAQDSGPMGFAALRF